MSTDYQTPGQIDWTGAMKSDVESGQKSVQDATRANRVNQNNPWGSSTWTQDPTTGQWTQNVTLNPWQQQQMQNQQAGLASTSGQASNIMQGGLGLGGQINMAGAPGYANYNGVAQPNANWDSVTGIQNAMLSRMQPALQQSQNAEQARLKAQGITEGSEAWNNAMTNQGQARNDMQMQALLAGSQAANDQFNRQQQVYQNQIGAKQLTDAQRQQMFAEQQGLRNQQMNELGWMQGSAVQDPNFGSFYSQGTAPGTDFTGALSNVYSQQLNAANMANASKDNTNNGLWNIAGQLPWADIASGIWKLF